MALKSVNGKLLASAGALTADDDCCCPDEDACEVYCPGAADYDIEITLPDLAPAFPETQSTEVEDCCNTYWAGTYTLSPADHVMISVSGFQTDCDHSWEYANENSCITGFPASSCAGCTTPECAECAFYIYAWVAHGRSVPGGDKKTAVVIRLLAVTECEVDGGIAQCQVDNVVIWQRIYDGWIPCSNLESIQAIDWDRDVVGADLHAGDYTCTGEGTQAAFQFV